jgi:hypothetical protein|tara:strand:+ start:687 stop:917 length:231 start_codon:yes stop_codon:yes gene_type:complete
MDIVNDKVVLGKKEFEAIQEVMHKLTTGVEGLLEVNYVDIADGDPLLYDAILELQERWDSHKFQDALKTWNDELDH